MKSLSFPLPVLLLLLCHPRSVLSDVKADPTSKLQFRQWFGQFGFVFEDILQQNCSAEYTDYLTHDPQNATIHWSTGGDQYNLVTQPVVECLLENTPQYIMSSMQIAQVLLGLTPTILAVLGASPDESATLAVVGQRPLLSFLLAWGSPSLYLNRAFEYKDPAEILSGRIRAQRYRQSLVGGHRSLTWRFRWLLVVLEYVVALGSAANIALLSLDLGFKVICGFQSEFMFFPLLWSEMVVAMHFFGNVWYWLRVKRVEEDEAGGGKCGWVRWVGRRVRRKFRLSLNNGPVIVMTADETKWYIFLGWWLSVWSVMHIIFGTLTLSSLLFIGPGDALKTVGRFVGSVLACRVVIMYELAGLRENYDDGLEEKSKEAVCDV